MTDKISSGRPEKEIGPLLVKMGLLLGLAESCTGGMISARITDVSGSSSYFAGGVVAYDNRVKEEVLGVPAKELELHGAVSQQVASSMARGVKKLLKTDFGLSVTGIAGPGGGSPEKPVGLVYIALDGPRDNLVKEYHFRGNRSEIRMAAMEEALEILKRELIENQKVREIKKCL
ncbi:MAG: CinA family protein [Bacillota bacterium]